MVFTLHLLWLFLAAMLISAIGFKNYVWFISLGYGFSIAGEGILMMFLYGKEMHVGRVTDIIRTRFLQADFRRYFVKILENP